MSNKRLILVTGASRGIGRAAAFELARRGHHVIGMARSQKALETLDDELKAKGHSATFVPMDLTDGKSIDALGQILHDRFGRLDGLVGNAGVLGTLGPLQTVSVRKFEETINVNLTANWRLIRSMSPLLSQSDAPRAVFITSGVVPRPRAYWGPYQASKAGLEALVQAWAAETQKGKLRVNLYDPGATRTQMRFDAMPGEDPETLPTPESVAGPLCDLVEAEESRTGQRVAFRDL